MQSYHGLLAARIFLGVAEAGLFPGVVYYNTMWYCRYEVQVRQAIFFSAASVAGAFSGLLAYGISFMDGVGESSKPYFCWNPQLILLRRTRRMEVDIHFRRNLDHPSCLHRLLYHPRFPGDRQFFDNRGKGLYCL